MNDLAAKSTRPARKKRFSTLMSAVSLEDGVLRIVGRRKLASVLLLMAMIGAIVLARRDVQAVDPGTGELADQGLIEKARTPLLVDQPPS